MGTKVAHGDSLGIRLSEESNSGVHKICDSTPAYVEMQLVIAGDSVFSESCFLGLIMNVIWWM